MPKAIGLVVVALLLGMGCATVYHAPQIEFRSIESPRISLDGGSVDVLLTVYNPNRFRLDVRSVTYDLHIENAPFGTGLLDERIVVEARDSVTVRLPLAFSWRSAGAAGRDLLMGRSVNYRIEGHVTASTPLGLTTRPFDHVGQFQSREAMRLF